MAPIGVKCVMIDGEGPGYKWDFEITLKFFPLWGEFLTPAFLNGLFWKAILFISTSFFLFEKKSQKILSYFEVRNRHRIFELYILEHIREICLKLDDLELALLLLSALGRDLNLDFDQTSASFTEFYDRLQTSLLKADNFDSLSQGSEFKRKGEQIIF